MRIALDAMGSDNRPVPDVEGAVAAAREYGISVVLVGDEARVKAELAKHQTTGLSLEVVHAEQEIDMADSPTREALQKEGSSMHVGLNLVESGDCNGFVSVGNTGALLSIATVKKVRRIKGVHRPTLSSIVSFKDRSIILADVGANVDCKPEWLAQFALMSNLYAKRAMGVSNPRVALLSNGEEETKGNNLIHETAALLKEMDLNFIGNVEPIGMVHAEADVLICDGFVGNVVAKTIEATGSIMLEALRDEIMRNMFRKLGGLILRQAFRDVYRQFDPFEIGGVPLLGVNGVVIIGHGRSNALAIKNAIRQAKQAVDGGIVDAIREGISAYENTNA